MIPNVIPSVIHVQACERGQGDLYRQVMNFAVKLVLRFTGQTFCTRIVNVFIRASTVYVEMASLLQGMKPRHWLSLNGRILKHKSATRIAVLAESRLDEGMVVCVIVTSMLKYCYSKGDCFARLATRYRFSCTESCSLDDDFQMWNHRCCVKELRYKSIRSWERSVRTIQRHYCKHACAHKPHLGGSLV